MGEHNWFPHHLPATYYRHHRFLLLFLYYILSSLHHCSSLRIIMREVFHWSMMATTIKTRHHMPATCAVGLASTVTTRTSSNTAYAIKQKRRIHQWPLNLFFVEKVQRLSRTLHKSTPRIRAFVNYFAEPRQTQRPFQKRLFKFKLAKFE